MKIKDHFLSQEEFEIIDGMQRLNAIVIVYTSRV